MVDFDLKREIEELLAQYNGLEVANIEKVYQIKGNYSYSLNWKGVIMENTREIQLNVPLTFPEVLPKLYVKDIPCGMSHVYEDGSVCVATMGEIRDFLIQTPSIKGYYEKFVNSFLYTIDWFVEYGTYPFGEREHGVEGLKSYYIDDWGLGEEQYRDLVLLVHNKKYRGHRLCLCKSGKKTRDCHGKRILPLVMDKSTRIKFLNEAELILKLSKDIKNE